MHFAALDRDDTQRQQARFATGIALSLALHALLLLAWRHHTLRLPDAAQPPRPIAVWLRPPAPKLAPPPQASTVRPPQVRPRQRATPGKGQRGAPPVSASPAREPDTVAKDELSIPQAPPAQPETAPGPRFDIDAARRFARRIADNPDPARRASAVGQFPEKPWRTESRAARAIASAKRGNCKDGLPGGLLAPLFLMLDKKDSGCKW
jgi:hypothetical protein